MATRKEVPLNVMSRQGVMDIARAIDTPFTQPELWNIARAISPTFRSHTSHGTAELFTERKFIEMQNKGTLVPTLNEFYQVIMPWRLRAVFHTNAKDPLEAKGFGEKYGGDGLGEYTMYQAVRTVKPVSPVYRNLEDGPSMDQWPIKRNPAEEIVFQPNFDYQAFITVPDAWMTKRVYTSMYGYDSMMTAQFAALAASYTVQKFVAKEEAINQGINRSDLLPTQSVEVSWPTDGTDPTDKQIIDLLISIWDILSIFDTEPQTDAFNTAAFADVQDPGRLRVLVRRGFKARLSLLAVRNSFVASVLKLPIEFIEVRGFGGQIPYADAAFTTPVYPVYDWVGAEIGFSETEGQTGKDNVAYTDQQVYYKDPNWTAGNYVLAIVADKGWLVEETANPYEVEPARHVRQKFTDYWASSANNKIYTLKYRNMIKIMAKNN